MTWPGKSLQACIQGNHVTLKAQSSNWSSARAWRFALNLNPDPPDFKSCALYRRAATLLFSINGHVFLFPRKLHDKRLVYNRKLKMLFHF